MADAQTIEGPRAAMRRPAAETGAGQKPREAAPAKKGNGLRTKLFIGFAVVLVIAALAYGGWWYIVGSHYVSTDDAYVDASTAQITPRVEGTIQSVPVNDTDHVKRGEVLVVIDPSDAQLAVEQAEANYNQAIRHVQQNFANVDAAKAAVAARKADLDKAHIDYSRRAALGKTGAVSGDELTTARNADDTAKANLVAAQQQLASQSALTQGSDVDHNPEVLAAKAQLDRARLDLSRTVIRAPMDGVVAQNTVQIGQHVQVGAALMSVVPITQVYVNANFKESQLTGVRPGQAATLSSDLYGSKVVFHGRVVGLGGGTGAAFALIPAQNATGNWIKVVQRLPVRIALEPRELAEHPLRVGLSMNAQVEISK
ncbi:MAG TPA: efflux RND transporter periplasmic adaptor subunit [Rhizomicrobium sp.]